MPTDKRRDARAKPEDEPFTNVQTYEEEAQTESTSRDDAAIGFERPPVRPRGPLGQ